MRNNSICDMSDTMATAFALGGKFEREDCGFFENCDHKIEKYDMTVPGGAMVEIFYCSIDWKKVGPLIAAVLVVLFLIYRRVKSYSPTSYIADKARSGYSRYYHGKHKR